MIRTWILAARPHTLWAAAAPVLASAGLAWGDGVFRWDAAAVAGIGAIAVQVAANFANDASDAARGADTDERIGPPRAVASGMLTSKQVWRATWIAFGLAGVAGIYLASISSWVILAIGTASVVAALTYGGGPAPYGYRGLGEVFVFVFFGVVATVASRFVHDSSAPLDAWLLSVPIGFVVTAILVANNVRDIETDAAAGKNTLAVMIGRSASVRLFGALVLGAFAAIVVFAATSQIPTECAVAVVALPLGFRVVRSLSRAQSGREMITVLQGTARLHFVIAALLAAGASLG